MITLTQAEEDVLRDLRQAGAAGFELGAEIATSTAIRFALLGLANMTTTRPQRSVITAQGVAYSRRAVWA